MFTSVVKLRCAVGRGSSATDKSSVAAVVVFLVLFERDLLLLLLGLRQRILLASIVELRSTVSCGSSATDNSSVTAVVVVLVLLKRDLLLLVLLQLYWQSRLTSGVTVGFDVRLVGVRFDLRVELIESVRLPWSGSSVILHLLGLGAHARIDDIGEVAIVRTDRLGCWACVSTAAFQGCVAGCASCCGGTACESGVAAVVVLFLLAERRLLSGLVAGCLRLSIKFPCKRVAWHMLRRGNLCDGLIRPRLRYTRIYRGRAQRLLLVVPGRCIRTKASCRSSSTNQSGVAAVMVFILRVCGRRHWRLGSNSTIRQRTVRAQWCRVRRVGT